MMMLPPFFIYFSGRGTHIGAKKLKVPSLRCYNLLVAGTPTLRIAPACTPLLTGRSGTWIRSGLRGIAEFCSKSATTHKASRGVDLLSTVLRFGRLWYGEPNADSNAVDYAKSYSRSDDVVIHGCD